MNVAVILITYNRIKEYKEVLGLYKTYQKLLPCNLKIFHEYDGEQEWYSDKTDEDFFFSHSSRPHYEGAMRMINSGIRHVQEYFPEYDFIILSSGDVRIKSGDYLQKVLAKAQRDSLDCVFSLWFFAGVSTEFLVMSKVYASRIFPLGETFWLNTKLGRKLLWLAQPHVIIVEFLLLLKMLKYPRLRIAFLPKRLVVLSKNRFQTATIYDSSHYKQSPD